MTDMRWPAVLLPGLARRLGPPLPRGRRRARGGPQGAGPPRLRRLGHRDRPRAQRGDGGAGRRVATPSSGARTSRATPPPSASSSPPPGDPDVDGAVYADADAAGVWVNSADDPATARSSSRRSTATARSPSSVSTGGLSPALASWLRTGLAAVLRRAAWDTLAELLAEARQRLRDEGRRSEAVDWAALLDGPLPELVRPGDSTTPGQLRRPHVRLGHALVLLALPAFPAQAHICRRTVSALRRADVNAAVGPCGSSGTARH